MNQRLSLLFYPKKSKDSALTIYLRITINNKRIEISTGRQIDPNSWDTSAQKVKGKSEEVKSLNSYLKSFEQKIFDTRRMMMELGKPFTSESLKNFLTGNEEKPRKLIEIITQHNNDIKSLIGKDYTRATWVKYNTTEKHLKEFLKWKHNVTDFNIKDLGYEFLADFEFFLKSKKNIDTNTNAKYIKNIKKIIRECVSKNWLPKDPFMAFKIKTKQTEREYLSEYELKALEEKVFEIERLNHVKDLFLFSCYTGLSYIMNKEEHPYIKEHSDFTKKWRYIIIGTFPPKRGCNERTDLFPFFYGNKGSLWDIIRDTNLYHNYDFSSIDGIKKWQKDYSICITDVIESCRRKHGKECSSADSDLVINWEKDLNINLRNYILKNIDNIEKLYFTSSSEDNNGNSAYFLFLKLMGDEMFRVRYDKIIKLPSPSREFLRTVFSKSKEKFGLKPAFYNFLESKYPDALEIAAKTFNIKVISSKTRVNRKGKTVGNKTKRFPGCPNFPSLYRLEEYKKSLPKEFKMII